MIYLSDVLWIIVFTIGSILAWFTYRKADRDISWFVFHRINGSILRDANELLWHERIRSTKQGLGLLVGFYRLYMRQFVISTDEIMSIAGVTTALAVTWSILLSWQSLRSLRNRKVVWNEYCKEQAESRERLSGIRRTRSGDTKS